MKKDTPQKAKFRRLMRRLGQPECMVAGVLEMIWNVAQHNALAGDIGRLSNEDIAAMIGYPGDADDLIAALVETGWLDEDPQHRLVIHNWEKHAPRWVKGVLGRRHAMTHSGETQYGTVSATELATQSGTQCATESALHPPTTQEPKSPRAQEPKSPRPSAAPTDPPGSLRSPSPPSEKSDDAVDTGGSGRQTSSDAEPDRQPDDQPPAGDEPDRKPRRRKPAGYSPEFERWWAVYPRREGKGRAAESYAKSIDELRERGVDDPHRWLRRRTRAYAEIRKAAVADEPDAAQFTPHASTWLNQRRFDDDACAPPPPPTGEELWGLLPDEVQAMWLRYPPEQWAKAQPLPGAPDGVPDGTNVMLVDDDGEPVLVENAPRYFEDFNGQPVRAAALVAQHLATGVEHGR